VAEASIVSVGALASERAPGAERITAPEGRICPACRRRLAPVTFAGVSIDYCASHGTWFDRGEIECVVRAARAPAATNVTSLAPDQPDSSWVLEVVSDIVGGLVD
jgi:Zn-finger nucleic acid-binding protein